MDLKTGLEKRLFTTKFGIILRPKSDRVASSLQELGILMSSEMLLLTYESSL